MISQHFLSDFSVDILGLETQYINPTYLILLARKVRVGHMHIFISS